MKKASYTKITHCRICSSEQLFPILSLGSMPIPNGFLKKEDLNRKEEKYPLEVCGCEACGLVQLRYIVDPAVMFGNYLYIPSASQTRINNFTKIAQEINEIIPLTENDLVVDVGSNDGSLLTAYKNLGIQILGVDPAENLVTIAKLHGIPTELGFFSPIMAKKIVKEYKKASVITATNVFAHIGDLHAFMKGVEILLADKGIFMVQFPYLLDLLRENQFDTIYHEHLSYFSLKPLLMLTEKTGLEIYDIIPDYLDGGSLKVLWKKKSNDALQVNQKHISVIQKLEEKYKLYERQTYEKFAKRVQLLKDKVIKKLDDLKKKQKTIVGYGAAAKGNVLLHYFDLSADTIQYLVDSTPYKQGLYTPGTHIPIFSESKISEDIPDYILILAWNFKEEIMKKNTQFTRHGGKFMIAIPKLMMLQ
ncbi:class I SAM-dependent methyltransferase [soil metagenome]